jgi:molybdopterin-guanine dinucleotide biosynthesis protein A
MTSSIGVVLAGGASRRMGTDKAFVDVGGRPMLLRVVDALAQGGCHVVVCQGGDVARAAALGLDTWSDVVGPAGPVGAIASALCRVEDRLVDVDTVVVAPCDLPMLDATVVRALIDTTAATGSVSVAVAGGIAHLVSAWPVSFAARVVGARASSFRGLLAEVSAIDVDVDVEFMVNVNTPTDVPGWRDGHRSGSFPVVPSPSAEPSRSVVSEPT